MKKTKTYTTSFGYDLWRGIGFTIKFEPKESDENMIDIFHQMVADFMGVGINKNVGIKMYCGYTSNFDISFNE